VITFQRGFVQTIIGMVFFSVLLFCCSDSSEIKPTVTTKENPFSALDFSKLESGDIVLKQGKGAVSAMIVKKLAEKTPLSHCGIVCKNRDSIYIIHSVAKELTGIDGVQSLEFKKFTEDCEQSYLYIVRVKEDAQIRKKVSVTAENYLTRRVPFDYQINYTDSDKVNCSELVYWSLLNASGKDFFERVNVKDQKVLAFNSLLDSSNFEVIYHY